MPLYNTQVPPPAIYAQYPCHTFKVFSADTLLTGQFSQQVHVTPLAPSQPGPKSLAVEIEFDVAPGVFEIDILESDTDEDTGDYFKVPVGSVVNAVDATNLNARVDLSPFLGQFVCLFVKTQPGNACKCTARVVRG